MKPNRTATSSVEMAELRPPRSTFPPKSAGRIKEILVREGDFVNAGQVVAIMDTEVLAAQHREGPRAHLQQMRSALATARSQLVQREAEKAGGPGGGGSTQWPNSMSA